MTKKKLFTTILALTMLTSIAVPVHAAETATTEQTTASEADTTVSKPAIAATFTGTAKNPKTGKLCYYTNGKVDKKYNSIAKYKKTWYKFKKGVVDKKYTGVAKRTENGKYYYIKKGKLDKKYTGVAKYPKNKKWYRIKKGRVDFKYTGIAKRPETGKWYYIKKGKWVKSYTGIAKYPKNNKSYYVKKGIVDFSYSGTVKDKATGKKYTVKSGKATVKKSSSSSGSNNSSSSGTSSSGQTIKNGFLDATDVYTTFNKQRAKHGTQALKRDANLEKVAKTAAKKRATTGVGSPRLPGMEGTGTLMFDTAKDATNYMCDFSFNQLYLTDYKYSDSGEKSYIYYLYVGAAGYYYNGKYTWVIVPWIEKLSNAEMDEWLERVGVQ